jgi:hypothetical protein
VTNQRQRHIPVAGILAVARGLPDQKVPADLLNEIHTLSLDSGQGFDPGERGFG